MEGNTSKSTYLPETRVISGMRASGKLHLGHYFGALQNWVKLQKDHQCFYFVANWHGLTTHYQSPEVVEESCMDMLIDWLAAGVDPQKSVIFIQSQIPQHAELHLLLSMITPLSWLERTPSYKDQREQIKDKDLSTYGFLGYPLLQSADILMYRSTWVPVGEDQAAHIEITREIARRFNHIYGNDDKTKQRLDQLLKSMSGEEQKIFQAKRRSYLEQGDKSGYADAREILLNGNYDPEDLLILLGYLDATGKVILPLPQALIGEFAKMPGTDGRKMSKSYGNTILLRDSEDEISKKIKVMPTDPARVRRNDKGNPEKCPVWEWHKIYSDDDTRKWVDEGCRSAGIGCLDCKKRLSDRVCAEQKPFLQRATVYQDDKAQLINVLEDGRAKATEEAEQTLKQVRALMGVGI
ncbi:MAG: tryptophan--tRNA ligase [Candidatus Portiera sp.]|nr:tryptophan--tRNA ligase [Portiera sp.]